MSNLSSGIFDKNGVELKVGDTVKNLLYLYESYGTTADWFGVEPQMSQKVYEVYIEEISAKVIFERGAFVFLLSNGKKQLCYDYLNPKNPLFIQELNEFIGCELDYSIVDYLHCSSTVHLNEQIITDDEWDCYCSLLKAAKQSQENPPGYEEPENVFWNAVFYKEAELHAKAIELLKNACFNFEIQSK